MGLEDIWDSIVEGFEYIFSFEWLGDIRDFFGSMFENMGEFSAGGLIVGILAFGLVYILRKQMLNPFLSHMGSIEAIIWGGLTYLTTFIGGYIIGKKIIES